MVLRLRLKFVNAAGDDPPADVAPQISDKTFNINDGYTDGQTVGTVSLDNTPSPAATFSITAGNTNSAFAIDADTGVITVAAATELVADSNYSLTVQASNTAGSDTATVTINVAAAGAAVELATMTLNNPDVSAQSADRFAAESFHYFAKGDIPTGTELETRASDGTTKITSVIRNRVYWSDGSLMGASIVPKPNAQITAAGTLAVKLFKSSTAHGTSGITAADVAGATDINVQGVSVSGLSAGTWTASLNDAITDGNYWTEDSEGGLTLTAYAPFNNGTSDSAQAGIWFFVTALYDGSGIYGYLIDIATHNGWHDETSESIDTIIFKDLKVRDGSTTLRTMKVYASDMTFTRTASTTFTVSSTADLDVPNGSTTVPVYLTNSGGALPTGLTADTGYWLRVQSSTTFSLHTTMGDALDNTSAITTSDAGSGTHTLHPAMWLDWYDGGKVSRDTDCKPIYLAGSVSEAPKCWPSYDTSYLVSTKAFGPIDLTITGTTALDHKPYYLGSLGSGESGDDFVWREDNAGERKDIGYMTGWNARAFHLQSANGYKRVLRDAMLYVGYNDFGYYRKSTFLPLNTDAGSHAGLGTAVPGACLRPSNPAANVGINAPASYRRISEPSAPSTTAHASQPAAFAYEVSGAPVFLHLLHNHTSRMLLASSNWKSEIVGGTTYSPVAMVGGDPQYRASAWSMAGAADSYRLTPETFRGGALKEMYNAMIAETADWWHAKQGTLNTFLQTNAFPPVHWTISTWMLVAYCGTVACRHYIVSEDADLKGMVEDMLTFFHNAAQNITSATTGFVANDDIYNSYKFNDLDNPSFTTYEDIDAWADCFFSDSGTNGHQKGYITMFRGTVKWAVANGFTLPSGMETDVDTEWASLSGANSVFTDAPVYALKNSFS